MGTLSLKEKQTAIECDEEDDERGNQANGLAEFRQFDPDFSGSSLSAIGCMDRVVACIGKELATWQREYQQAIAYNRAIQKGDIAGELRMPPLKPCHIVIITGSTAKLGKEWMPVYRLKVARYMDPMTKQVKLRRNAEGEIYTVPCCPGCGRAIKDERRAAQLEKMSPEYRELLAQVEAQRNKRRMEAFEVEALEPPMLYLTEQDLIGTKDRRVKRSCSECGEALWQYVAVRPTHWRPYSVLDLKKEAILPLPLPERDHPLPCITNTFRRRYPLGDYLLKHYKHIFHLLIADEVHEGSDGTALDFARQRLASACGRMMGLTGTLSNGYSASLFRLYYLLNPAIRRDFGYQDVERWIDAYGKRQTTLKTYKEQEVGHGSSSDRRIGKPVTKEVPGFAPQGLARVLPCSTFLELCDVVPGLPPYREEVHQVDLGPMLGPAYEAFEQETTRAIGRMLACGDKSGLSSWWNGLLTYPNMPYQGWTCMVKKSGEILGRAPALPENQLYPKEQALVNIIQREYGSGRRVLIYTENTGTLDILPRLKKILETKVSDRTNQPINVAVLRSTTVDPINREAWLDKQVEAGCDVLICNPKLVRVGLDLLAFPTIIYASLPKSTSDLRQSSRRSLRPGQTKPVKVLFLVYPTMEFRLLRLMARKMKASLMVEGKLPGEGLVSFGEEDMEDEHDMYVQLAREMLASLEAEKQGDLFAQAQELQAVFQENARIEQAKNQSLGMEEQKEPVAFDPIQVETLAISDAFIETEMLASDTTLTEQASAPVIEAARTSVTDEPVTVTIIHTSITSGQDPWAALRARHLRPRKRYKAAQVATGTVPDLWAALEQSSRVSPDILRELPREPIEGLLVQKALW